VLKEKIAQAEIHIRQPWRGALIKLQEAITTFVSPSRSPSALMIEKIDLFTKETAKARIGFIKPKKSASVELKPSRNASLAR